MRTLSISVLILFLLTSATNRKLNQHFFYSNNQFGYDVYRALAAEKENFAFSPFSISTALSMAIKGADGETKTQMEKMLYMKSSERLHKEFYNEYSTMMSQPKQLLISNGAWAEQTYRFSEEYKKTIQDNFFATIKNVDFKNQYEQIRNDINHWVEEKTQKNIKDLLPEKSLSDNTRLVLCNAIYFKDAWSIPFEPAKTRKQNFYAPDGVVQADFMNLETNLRCYENENIKMVALRYKADPMEMFFILPGKDKSLQDLEAILSEEYISECVLRMTTAKVTLSIPKFITGTDGSLKEVLIGMGMKDAFDDGKSNFSKMDPTNSLYVSDIFHQAKVIVNEKGTEAAAATGIVMNERSAGPPDKMEFIADHPFIFLLRSNNLETDIFLGRVMNPLK